MIAIGADHRGFKYKSAIIKYLRGENYDVKDFGTDSEESVDYPDYAKKVAESVAFGDSEYGVLICGSGIGVNIVANKVKGIRAVNAVMEKMAEMGRKHNNVNILCLGQDFVSEETAINCVKIFLSTEFEGGRHQNRVDKIHSLTGC